MVKANDTYGLYYCRQCVCLYQAGSSQMFEDDHMSSEHPGFPGSWDHFEYEMKDAQKRFWDAYGDRRWRSDGA
ncbi:hypothetical protein HCTV-16_gp158 [Haloarcula virus HCTV-16]|nr:hypothetical protein HCTV-16_gp158 [Haloarcula virus HCTV-16]